MKKSTLSIPEIIAIALEKMVNKDCKQYSIRHTMEVENGFYRVSYFRYIRFKIGDILYTVKFFKYRGEHPKSGYFYRSEIPVGKYVITEYDDTFNEYETTRFIEIQVEY